MSYCPFAKITNISALDTSNSLDPKLPRLRSLSLTLVKDPSHEPPQYLNAKFGKSYMLLPFDRPRQLLTILNSILLSYYPDVVQTHYGDAWLFPYLELLSLSWHVSVRLH